MSVCVRSGRRTVADLSTYGKPIGLVPGVPEIAPMGGIHRLEPGDELLDEIELQPICARRGGRG